MSSEEKQGWQRQVLRRLGPFAALNTLLMALTACSIGSQPPSTAPEKMSEVKAIPQDPSMPHFEDAPGWSPSRSIGATLVNRLAEKGRVQDYGRVECFPETNQDGAPIRRVVLTFWEETGEKVTVTALTGGLQKPNLRVVINDDLFPFGPQDMPENGLSLYKQLWNLGYAAPASQPNPNRLSPRF